MDFNLWENYNTDLNLDWTDPWYEYETHGIYNGPSTGNDDPAYEQTQNAYGIYNWFRWKGYQPYALSALLASSIHESTCTGGVWEVAHPYPGIPRPGFYYPLMNFDAQSLAGVNSRNWYDNGTGLLCTWNTTVTNPNTGLDEPISATPGSWDAAIRSKPVMDAQGNVTWDRTQAQYTGAGTGYGLCQFTPWTKLTRLCGACTTDGDKHWQLNLTLTLMVYEYQRSLAMTPGAQSQSGYMGEWLDSDGRASGLEINGTFWPYGQDITWDEWASDAFIPWVDDLIANHYPTMDATTREWCRRCMALNIYAHCYLHAPQMYVSLDFEQLTLYTYSAIIYWDNNGGYNIYDIPRARDIPECELDGYWYGFLLMIFKQRRRKAYVRTIYV